MSGKVDLDHSSIQRAIAHVDTLHRKLTGLKAVAGIDITHRHLHDDGGKQERSRHDRSFGGAPAGRILV